MREQARDLSVDAKSELWKNSAAFFFFKVKVIVYTVLFGEGMKILIQILTVHVQTVWLVVYRQVFSGFYHLVSPQFAWALDPVFFPHETSSFCFLGFFFF